MSMHLNSCAFGIQSVSRAKNCIVCCEFAAVDFAMLAQLLHWKLPSGRHTQIQAALPTFEPKGLFAMQLLFVGPQTLDDKKAFVGGGGGTSDAGLLRNRRLAVCVDGNEAVGFGVEKRYDCPVFYGTATCHAAGSVGSCHHKIRTACRRFWLHRHQPIV